MNKFLVLNTMQKSLVRSNETHWEVSAHHTVDALKRVRLVSFIIKSDKGYCVTLTETTHKTFMGALASLMGHYLSTLRHLIQSMLCCCPLDAHKALGEVFTPGDFSRPSLPTYDRGPKKEYLHPLRKAVTAMFGGKYSR